MSSLNISSPPPTPSTPGPGSARLNTNATAFVPGGVRASARVTLKRDDGTEVNIESLKSAKPPSLTSSPSNATVVPPVLSPSPSGGAGNRKSVQIRMESEEAKKKRIEQEEQERQKAEKEKEEEKARKDKEEERIKKDEEERIKREAEEQETKRKAEEEEMARVKREEEKEKERLRKEEEEKERARFEREKKKEEEEKERLRLEEQKQKEKERLLKEEEERVKAKELEEAEAKARAAALDEPVAETPTEVEEGEVKDVLKDNGEENAVTPTVETPAKDTGIAAANPGKDKDGSLRIDTTATPSSAELPRKRPGPLDLSYASKPNIPAPLPSALATARIIDDLGRVPYPEGVKSPRVELNVNAKDGKFR